MFTFWLSQEDNPSRIFAAEVRGKRPSADVGEDELTSRILGVFAHLSAEAQTDFLRSLEISEVEGSDTVGVRFWPRLAGATETRELDALITVNGRRIAFEFKWGSDGDSDQLISERRLLGPEDLLVYVTKSNVAPPEVGQALSSLPSGSTLSWIPWRKWLRGARKTRKRTRDPRDNHLLDDMISYMEVLGMADWQTGLEQYWKVAADRSTKDAYQGLSGFFKELRTHLKDRHSAKFRIGEAQTSFAYKSWVELTPVNVLDFAENLAVYVVLNHIDQHWEFTFEKKFAPRESVDRARERVNDLDIEDVDIGEGDVVAKRSFDPGSDFSAPATLMNEIEDGLLRFANDMSSAFPPERD